MPWSACSKQTIKAAHYVVPQSSTHCDSEITGVDGAARRVATQRLPGHTGAPGRPRPSHRSGGRPRQPHQDGTHAPSLPRSGAVGATTAQRLRENTLPLAIGMLDGEQGHTHRHWGCSRRLLLKCFLHHQRGLHLCVVLPGVNDQRRVQERPHVVRHIYERAPAAAARLVIPRRADERSAVHACRVPQSVPYSPHRVVS